MPRSCGTAAISWSPRRPERLIDLVRPLSLLHLGWYTTPPLYWSSPANISWLESSLRLFRAFAGAGGKRAVFAGTCAEYDWGTSGLCSEETTPLRPGTLYGVCKNALASIVLQPDSAPDVTVAWARIFFPYGPHDHPARVVPSVTAALLRREPARCSAGTQVRDFLHVADVASALCLLLEADFSGAVNIGSGEGTTVKRVLELIGEYTGRPDLLELGALPPRAEPPALVADARKLREELGWSPAIPLEAGLEQTVGWWRAVFSSNQELRS